MADTKTVSATNNSVGRLITEQQLASFKVVRIITPFLPSLECPASTFLFAHDISDLVGFLDLNNGPMSLHSTIELL